MLGNLMKQVPMRIYNRNVLCGIKNLHSTPPRLLVKEKAQTLFDNRISEILSKYTTEQKDKLLTIANNCDIDELLAFNISKARANKLIKWRMRNGLLKNLNDIFSVESFGPRNADKFLQSLLLEPNKNKPAVDKGPIKTASFTVPPVDREQCEIIKSCVAIRIGVNSITWSRLDVPDRDVNVPWSLTHWEHHEISETKLNLNELIQRCLYVHHLIPEADCYVFENPKTIHAGNTKGGVEQQNINIQKSQVTAIMGFGLAFRNNQLNGITDKKIDKSSIHFPNVFYIRRFLSARLFNHLVGTERVSSEQTILNMMRTFYNINETQDFLPSQQDPTTMDTQYSNNGVNFSDRVQFPAELRRMFSQAPHYYREFLGQSLLLNLTFVRLVLLRDAQSIAILSRRVEDTGVSKQKNIEVVLKTFVDGLGGKGDVISVKPNFAYNKLLLTGLAAYKTEENLAKYAKKESENIEPEHSSPFAQRTVNMLQSMNLSVVMNKDHPWVIEPWHIKASLRKADFICKSECNTIPKEPIEGPDLKKENKSFYCTVTINILEKARVKCRIHHWSTDPSKRLPYVFEHWKLPEEPIIGIEKVVATDEVETKNKL